MGIPGGCTFDSPIGETGPGAVREFETGATRDALGDKPDYDGFLSPLVLERYAAYMHKCRIQSDGKLRDSDNWQKGIPREVYRKSAFRHFMEWWKTHRNGGDVEEAACALLFNIMGDLFEVLKEREHEKLKGTDTGSDVPCGDARPQDAAFLGPFHATSGGPLSYLREAGLGEC